MKHVLHTAPSSGSTRRQVLAGLAAWAGAAACHATGPPPAAAPVQRQVNPSGGAPMPVNETFQVLQPGRHEVRPLPFAPGRLAGLSERLLVSHHENNYAGAVKNLNRVEEALASAAPDTPPFVVAGLRERELTFRNSVALHEAYFGNLGGDGQARGPAAERLAAGTGGFAAWESAFRAAAAGLYGGSGWVVLCADLPTGRLRTSAGAGHALQLAAGWPLLVLDMFEHSYALDYGAAAAKYVDAFFANLRWDEVDRRLESADRALGLLRG
jgi:Fe-Mn family superoxide dismutase